MILKVDLILNLFKFKQLWNQHNIYQIQVVIKYGNLLLKNIIANNTIIITTNFSVKNFYKINENY